VYEHRSPGMIIPANHAGPKSLIYCLKKEGTPGLDDLKKDFFSNFDWKTFEQWFGGKLPPFPEHRKGDMAWVEQYVQDILKKAFPQSLDLNLFRTPYRTEVFETHNSVVVKIHIPDRSQARKVRAFVGINRVKLEGLPDNRQQTVPLNAHVIPDSCKAVYKDGVLQLYIRKTSINDRLQEVNIRFRD
jgi:hypothetical protein